MSRVMERSVIVLFLLGFLDSSSSASSHTNPTYENCSPNYSYSQEAVSVKGIDFKNLQFGMLCDRPREFLKLANGRSKVKKFYDCVHDQAGLIAVHYFDSENGQPRHAVARFWYTTVGGSSSPS